MKNLFSFILTLIVAAPIVANAKVGKGYAPDYNEELVASTGGMPEVKAPVAAPAPVQAPAPVARPEPAPLPEPEPVVAPAPEPEPMAEEPKVEEPAAEEPKVEEPAAEVEEPKEEPKTEVEEKPASPDIKNQLSEGGPSWWEGIEIGANVGLLNGFGVRLGYRYPYSDSFWKNRLSYRLDYNTMSPVWNKFKTRVNDEIQDRIDEEVNDKAPGELVEGLDFNDVRGEVYVKGRQIGALVDFRPFGYTWGLGGLRLTGGYYVGKLDLGASVYSYTIDLDDFEFDDTISFEGIGDIPVYAKVSGAQFTEATAGAARAGMRLNSRGPYLGIGWDINLIPFLQRSGLHITLDAGVVFTKPHRVYVDVPQLLNVPDGTTIELSIDTSTTSAQQQQDFADLIDKLNSDFGLGLSNTLTDISINITPAMVQTFKDEYGGFIDSLNEDMQREVNNALEGYYDDNGEWKKGINQELKDYPYFPMVKVGLMWRF